jgi:replicative DNA helicase
MDHSYEKVESDFLGTCLLDGTTIDRAIQAGVTAAHFVSSLHREQWRLLVQLRLAGKPTDVEGAYAAAAADPATLAGIGGAAALVLHQQNTSLHGGALIAAIVSGYAHREAGRLLSLGSRALAAGELDLDGVRGLAEQVVGVCSGQQRIQRSLADIAAEAVKDVKEQISGKAPTRSLIYTGLPTFDKYATPMETHEYVVVGARTSHGKSSFLTQVAGHNLSLKKKVAIFTLETSDKSVLKQIVGQRAKVNLRDLAHEPADKQQEYLAKLEYASTTKNLLIFDQDMSLTAIESRCRLLAQSWKPDLVIIDYLGILRTEGTSQYERITAISKAMIPLRKALGCTLMIGCQLGRGSEKEERQPQRTDFRDSGSIEEDSSRLIVLWRKPGQPLDLTYFDCEILQLKLRDGPTTSVACRFHAPTTLFVEGAA